MNIFSLIAERRIREAMENGEFDSLERKGKPIHLEADTWIPEDMRAAYRMLKNAGYIPQELTLRNDIMNLQKLIDTLDDDKERLKKIRALNFKMLKLGEMRKRPVVFENVPEYENKVHKRYVK